MFAMFAHIAGRVFDVLSRSVLELFLGIFHAIPVNAMRNNVPPSVWWTVYRCILVIASVLLSLRLLVTVELDEETQKVFGDVYHFLTENTRLLTYASVALKSSTLLMTIFLSTKKGKAALQLLIPTLTRHREAPSRQGRFVEYALKASILFVIGWYVVIIWVYRAKFDHEKHPVAAGVWGTAAGVWITDIFLGLATLCALHFVIVDELDREAAAALEEARDLLAPLPNNLMIVPPMVNGQLVVDHFLRVIRSNAQLNGFEGYFMSSLYTLFVTISIVLYEIFFGVPSHGFIRAMLVASLVFEGAVFFFPNWVADSLNETKVKFRNCLSCALLIMISF